MPKSPEKFEGTIEAGMFELDKEAAEKIAETLRKTGGRMMTEDELKVALNNPNFIRWVQEALTKDKDGNAEKKEEE